jgi:hypothetical protein
MSINNYFNIPNTEDEKKKKSGAVSSGNVSNYFKVPEKVKEEPIVTQKQEKTVPVNTEVINIDNTQKKTEAKIPKQEVISQGKEDTRKEDTIWSRLGRVVLPNFLEKELGIDETQRQTTLTKAETVKMQGMETTKYLAEKNPESIAPTEYLRRGLSFGNELDPTDYLRGYKSDVSVEDLPEPTTPQQKIAEAVGSLITMSIAQPLIEGAFVKAVSYFPKGAKVLETLSTASKANPWTVGYGLNVAKAGAEGGLFGLITENRKSVAENVLETAGTFAAFTALAFPIQQFFKPIIQSVGKMKIENPRIKNILNDPAITKPTVSKTVWFKNPNDETQLLKVTGNGMEFVTKSGEMVEKGVYVKDIPTLTSVDIEAFKVKPSVYENLKKWVGGKIKNTKVDFKVKDTVPESKLKTDSIDTNKAIQEISNLKPAEVRDAMVKTEKELDLLRSGLSTGVKESDIIYKANTLRDSFNDYNEQNKEIILNVKGDNSVPLASIEVVEYNDGKFMVRTDVNISTSGFGTPFTGSYKSREEAINAGKKSIETWINKESNLSATDKKEIEKIKKEINSLSPKEVTEEIQPIEKEVSIEDKKYDNVEDFIKSQTPIYHYTNAKFNKFDLSKTEAQSVWFTDNANIDLKTGDGLGSSQVGSGGAKYKVDRYINPNAKIIDIEKSDLTDKYTSGQLIDMGYAGIKVPQLDGSNWYEIWEPNKDLLTKSQLKSEWEKIKTEKSKRIGVADYNPAYTENMIKLIKEAQDNGDLFPFSKFSKEEQNIFDNAWRDRMSKATKTQKDIVKEAVKGEPKTIKQIAEETKILEPNVRRILGVGAKDGTFERLDAGVYVLKKDGKELAYVEANDAVDALARMVTENKKFDSVILDPAYFSRALIGGNRGIKEWGFIMPPEFDKVMTSISKLVTNDKTQVYLMLSGARTAQPDMEKYVKSATDAGFKVVGEGTYKKLTKDLKPVTNVRGVEASAERLILMSLSGEVRKGEIPVEMDFRFIRPSIAKSYQTEKPAELMKALIEQSTLEGESVLDPFAGSGVTGAEAIKSGRVPTLVEKKPEVVEKVIKPRLLEATKQKNEVKRYENILKQQIGDTFEVVKPIGDLWNSKNNTLFISPKKERIGYLNWLRERNFIESAEEAGNNIFKVNVKPNLQEQTPSSKTEVITKAKEAQDIYTKDQISELNNNSYYDVNWNEDYKNTIASIKNKVNLDKIPDDFIETWNTFLDKYTELYKKDLRIIAENPSPSVTGRAGYNFAKRDKSVARNRALMDQKEELVNKLDKDFRSYKFQAERSRKSGMSEVDLLKEKLVKAQKDAEWAKGRGEDYWIEFTTKKVKSLERKISKLENGEQVSNIIKKETRNERYAREMREEKGGALGFNPKNLDEISGEKATKEVDKIIKRSEIAKRLSDKFAVPIRQGKFRHAGAIGLFKPNQKVIRIKKGGMGTLFHELGHFLDGEFELSGLIPRSERVPLMSNYGYSYAGQPEKQRKEAFAEFLRYKMIGDNKSIEKYAPKFAEIFEKKMSELPEVKDVLDVAFSDYQKWLEQPAVAKILSHISLDNKNTASLKDRFTNNLHNLYTMGVDELHPLSEFTKIATENLGKIPEKNNPYILARNLRGWVGKANTFLEKGTFGKNYWTEKDGKIVANFKGKSFNEILKPISDAGKLDDFRVYLVSKRAKELAGRKITTGIKEEDADIALAELEKNNPTFKEKAKEIYNYQDQLLEYAKENGLIGEEGFKKIKELNAFRVPFYRVMETERSNFMGGKKVAGNIKAPIRKIKGSEREIIDPIESIIKDTYAIINSAERNNVGLAIAKLADKNFELGRLFEEVAKPMKPVTVNVKEVLESAFPDVADLIPADAGEKTVTLFRPMQDMGDNMLTINFGDSSKVYQVDPDLFKALQGINAEDMSMILKIISYPAKLLRAGATLSPDFVVRNPMRDQFSAFVFSKYGYKPFWDMARGMFETFKKGDVYDLWRMSGGESSMLVSGDRDSLKQTLKELLASKGAKGLNYVKHPVELLRALSEFGEKATRLGEMRRALKAHADPVAGAFASREVTLDFARIGAKTKAVNSIIAFWNANIQDMDKIRREFKEKPTKMLLRLFLSITLPSILLYLANRDDKRWKEIPQWQKNTFWIVFTDKHIYRIPKPFLLGTLFGSVPERALEYMDTKDPELFKDMANTVADGVTPSYIPTGLLPVIENQANYSFFKDRPIVSRGKENLPPKYQTSTYTSEVAKIVGEALNYSPDKVDNLLYGYTGGLGRYGTNIIDFVLKTSGVRDATIMPTKTIEEMPVIKSFMIKEPYGSSSESVNKVYNFYSKSQSKYNYFQKLSQGEATSDKLTEYLKENPEVAKYTFINGVVSEFSAINKAKNVIYQSNNMLSTTKKKKILELEKLQTKIANDALNILKND